MVEKISYKGKENLEKKSGDKKIEKKLTNIKTKSELSLHKKSIESGKRKILARDDFNYKSPSYDKDGNLKAREGLLKPEQVEDGYSSIKELFTKLNSMNLTQIEPLIKPYYYGEIDKKTGKKIPTFIIIGDIHFDEYNISKKDFKNFKDKKDLIEDDESYKAEVEVLKILKDKFGIKTFGLEGEIYGEKNKSKIGKGANKIGIKTFGLEKNDTNLKPLELLAIENIYIYHYYKVKYGVNLDKKLTKTDLNKILRGDKILFKTKKELIQFEYQYHRYKIEKEFGTEVEMAILEKAKSLNISLKENRRLFNENDKEYSKAVIETRNKIGIDIASKQMGKDKIVVMVWGKEHSEDLIKQLKEKYNSKVNIYVAK